MKFFIPVLVGCLFTAASFAQAPDSASTNLKDTGQISLLEEVVISASRVAEKILQSPVSINKLTAQYFKTSAAPSFFDALENVKGLQMITPGMGFKVITTRGFANTTNVRFAQLVDGMDIQAPHLGMPIANALGPNDLDIETVEIIPGAATTLYGMNSINGFANFITRDPFTNAGVSIQQKTGINRINDATVNASIFTETSLRIAHTFTQKFAVKFNGSFTKGNDWVADDRSDLNSNANQTVGLSGTANLAYDPVNGYGNESPNRRTLALQGKNYVVSRTGYYEKQVADYDLQNARADITLMYKMNNNSVISYSYKFATLDNIYQRSNRFRLEGYVVQQHGLTVKTRLITAHAYWNKENTGQSYNLRSMAENMDRNFKSDDTWYRDFTNRFNSSAAGGTAPALALQDARNFADAGRLEPGSSHWNTAFNQLKNINNWDTGAALRVKANLVNVDAQLNISGFLFPAIQKKINLEIIAGLDYRTYVVVPDGNYFVNPVQGKSTHNLIYDKTGGYIAATKKALHNKLKFGAALRVDKNAYFHATFNPRFTLVYSPDLKNNFRMAYQSGYRFPSLFEGFSNVNSGGVKRVGGLKVMSAGVFENSWLKSSIDLFQAAVIRDVNTRGVTRHAAIKQNQALLAKNNYTYLVPEYIRSVETGYKGLLFKSRLYLDVDFYFNNYRSFIAQVEASVPKTNLPDSIPFYLNERRLQDRYRLWTNSKTRVSVYGSSIGLKYTLPKGYLVALNVSYAKLVKKTTNDGLEDGFNTPPWMGNISLSNDQVYKGLGAAISYKWQDAYYWQSFLVNGQVPAYGSLDLQVTYQFKPPALSMKLGATNVLNHYYHSFLGGPAIGGFYYSTVTYKF
jgi:iron complex outermembrane receptor protein